MPEIDKNRLFGEANQPLAAGDTVHIRASNSANIWLYKKSDIGQVLRGSAPDAGAYEFVDVPTIAAPQNLRLMK